MTSRIGDIYRNPIYRKPAVNRLTVTVPRLPATNRKVVGFINDGKPHVILDTNIIIGSLEYLANTNSVNPNKECCFHILEALKQDYYSIGIHALLFGEYNDVGNRLAKSGKISALEYSKINRLVRERAFTFRMMVTKQHIQSNSYKDDHLFDCLSGDYLVSDDKNVLNLINTPVQTRYKKIVDSNQFLEVLKKQYGFKPKNPI